MKETKSKAGAAKIAAAKKRASEMFSHFLTPDPVHERSRSPSLESISDGTSDDKKDTPIHSSTKELLLLDQMRRQQALIESLQKQVKGMVTKIINYITIIIS